jgi:hypothetical protein
VLLGYQAGRGASSRPVAVPSGATGPGADIEETLQTAIWVGEGTNRYRIPALAKPFTMEALRRRVRELLDRGG